MNIKNGSIHLFASLLISFTVSIELPAMAQVKDTAKVKNPAKTVTPAIPAVKPLIPGPAELKPYNEIIPATAKTSKGFFWVHKVADKYFLEIPDSLLGREILAVNRISRSAADFRKPTNKTAAFAGDMIGENVFNFVKGPANKLFVSVTSYKERSSDTSANGMQKSLLRSTMQPLVSAFPIKAVNKDRKTSVIEITDYLNTDNPLFGFDADKKTLLGLTMPAADRSYLQSVQAYPMNIEVKMVKTYQKSEGGFSGTSVYTFEMNSSMVLLPEKAMQARQYDPRVGYFADEYTDFDLNPLGVKTVSNILRWRMEPKAADLEQYKRGALVQPEKPIVIYIDPATPKKWVPFLIQGINDWQAAFEQAGFKNAIMGAEVPVNDTTWSIDDARHNVLVYKPADVASSSGDIIRDPRSGEILEAHIGWYHNALDQLYKSYFIQAGATDPAAGRPQLDDALMGALIRAASSREIGNKLGLRYNLGASAAVPVANLRNNAWLASHGYTPSIMDYTSYNYVAQPEDHIDRKNLLPRIGDYDKWAIEWGYRLLPDSKTPKAENAVLNTWILNKIKSGNPYVFGGEEDALANAVTDPRNQRNDMGNDAVLASTYGLKNLKRVAPNLLKWTQQPDENYDKAGEMYQELINQYERYMQHVANNIGGIYVNPKNSDQPGPVYTFVNKEKQRSAMRFLQQELFATPYWLKNDPLYKLTYTGFSPVMNVQKNVLSILLDAKCINKLMTIETAEPLKAYTAVQMLTELKKGVFAELPLHKNITLIRRELQKAYVVKLSTMLQAGFGADSDAGSVLRGHAKQLMADLKNAVAGISDPATKAHLIDMSERLYLALYNPGAIPVPQKKTS